MVAASDESRGEQIGPLVGIPIFGLDALSSAACGPEAAITLLIPLGAAGISYIVPISVSIIVLLTILYFSYRQTIQAYPGGGGSYTVARQNLGASAGLLAAAALMIELRSSRRSWYIRRRGRNLAPIDSLKRAVGAALPNSR